MKRTHLIPLLLGIAAIVALFFALYVGGSSLVLNVVGGKRADAPASGAGLVGNRLPYFDLPTLAGDRVRSSDFTGTPLVIVFWTTWNAQAADEIHILDQYLTDRTSESGLAKVVAIDSQEETIIVSSFMNRGGYQVEMLLDTGGVVGERYAVKGLPTFYFVDRTGVVQEVYTGMLNQSILMNKIENILQ